MSVVQIDWKPDGPALRSFGRTVIIGSLPPPAALPSAQGCSPAAVTPAGAAAVTAAPGPTRPAAPATAAGACATA